MGVWEWELPSGEVRWSERAAALFGMALQQFDGSADTVMRMVHPDDRQRVRAVVDDCIEGRTQDFFAEYRVVRQDGKVRWLEARGRLYRSETGEPVRMAGLTTDVTDQKLSELALAESEERYRSVISGLAEGVMLIAPDGQCLTANESAERILGLTRDELMGRKLRDPAWQTVYADGTPFPASDYPAARTLETGQPCSDVLMGVRRGSDGLRWITINTKPLFRTGDARPHAVVASFADVTDRMAAEAAQRESEERYRTLVEHAPEAIVVLDPDSGHFVDVNENATRLFGLPRAALLALGPLELSAPVQLDGRSSAEAAPAYIAAAVRGETPVFEWVHRDADGWDITCEVRLVRLRSGERWLVRGSILDIGERKRIEAALRESEAKFAAVFRVCPESISISSVDDGVYVDVNDAYEQVFGYRRERVLGRSALDLGVWVDALERRDLVRRLRAGQDRAGLRRQHPARRRGDPHRAHVRRHARAQRQALRHHGGARRHPPEGAGGGAAPGRARVREHRRGHSHHRSAQPHRRGQPGLHRADRLHARRRCAAASPRCWPRGATTAASSTRCGKASTATAAGTARCGTAPRPARCVPTSSPSAPCATSSGTVLNYVGRAARHLHHQAVAAAARVPGQLRRPHRPGQPQSVLHAPEGGDREGLAPPPPARRGVRRPGQLQGHQRHARPRRGRRAALRDRQAHQDLRAPGGRGVPAGRRRVHRLHRGLRRRAGAGGHRAAPDPVHLRTLPHHRARHLRDRQHRASASTPTTGRPCPSC